MSPLFYIFMTILVLCVTIIFCLIFIRYWLLGREEVFWDTGESGAFPIPQVEEVKEEEKCESISRIKRTEKSQSSLRSEQRSPLLSPSSAQFNKDKNLSDLEDNFDTSSPLSSPQQQPTDDTNMTFLISDDTHNPTNKFFVFPLTKGGLASGEGNILPSMRHSFRNPPREQSLRRKKNKKRRRSLPEVLSQFNTHIIKRDSETMRPQHHQNQNNKEIVIHIEDFDECCNENVANLGLPVCEESPPTRDEIVEVKPIIKTSGSNYSFKKLFFATKRKQETLI